MPTVPTILRRFPYVLVVNPNAKFTSEVFLAFVKGMGECLIVGSAYHRNTNARMERANDALSDTLCAYANEPQGPLDSQDSRLTGTLAERCLATT